MAPLRADKACLKCHTDYEVGDVRGGISVSISAADNVNQMKQNKVYTILSALGVLILVFGVIFSISCYFIKDLRRTEHKLYEMATKDFLTGLLNRGEGLRRLKEEISRSVRSKQPLSVIILDIDYFKKINDNHGHLAGDHVLQEVAKMVIASLRNYDIICRYGEEEFLAALPATSLQEALRIARRLRKSVEEMEITRD